MAIRIQLRRDTAANWTSVNPVLANGEMGIETDTLKAKIGNGSATWSSRPYINVLPSELTELAQDAVNSAIVAGVGLDKTYDDAGNTITLDIDSTVATKTFAAELLTNATKSNIVITGDQNGLTITAENGVADSTTDNLAEGSTNKYFTDERAQDAIGNILGTGLSYNDAGPGIGINNAALSDYLLDGVSGSSYGLIGTSAYLDVKNTNGYNKEIELDIAAVESKLVTDGFAKLASPTFTGTVAAQDLTLSGNLTVNGTTTNLNSTNLVVEDKNIILGDTATPTDTTADGGGITLKGTTDKTLAWSDATDSWTSSENVNLASGKSYNLNGTNIKDVAETLTNKTLTSPIVSGLYLSDNSITFEGQGGDDIYETILSVENPTADRTIILPNSSDTLVGRATADTLTNKTLTLPKVNENATVTATSSEINVLDGITASTAELNKLDGVNTTTAEINILAGAIISTEELNRVDGARSNIQDQIDTKQPIISGVSDTEIGYLDGVTSSIQTQLNDKLPKAGGTMTGAIAMGTSKITGLGTPTADADASTKLYVDTRGTSATNSSNTTTTNKIGDATVDGTTGNTVSARINTAKTDAYNYTDAAIGTLGNTVSSGYVPLSIVAQEDGVASLNSLGYVPFTQLDPSISILDPNGDVPLANLNSTVVITTDAQTLTNKTLTLPKINEDVALTATATELNYVDGVTSSIQTQLGTKLDLSGGTMTGALTLSGAPTSSLHAATKAYVDGISAGLNFHQPVVAATSGNLAGTYNNGTDGFGATLTKATNGAIGTIDGATVAVGNRILLRAQTNATENGIYTITAVGSVSAPWQITRAADADNNPAAEVATGDFTFVTGGSTNGSKGFIITTAGTITLGTTNINYSQFNASEAIIAGTGISKSGATISIDTAVTADISTAQTLTNKTISGASNTLTNIPNSSLVNNSITLGTVTTVLGTTYTTLEGFTAISATTFNGALNGNASTVTNGVTTTGSYTDPTWLTLTKSKVGLGNVENTALTTWAGSTALTTLGTITAGTWTADTIQINKGGTGATDAGGAINNLLPAQATNAGKYLTTNGSDPTWAAVPAGYFAPTVGTTTLESGTTYSGFANLLLATATINDSTINTATMTGAIIVPTPTANSHAATKLYTDTTATTAATAAGLIERTYTNERLDIVPIDDISTSFNGSNSRFVPKVAGSQITISNPLRLLVTINGIIQMLGNQDNHWLSPIAPDGFYIDKDGYIQFTEPVPEGSTFDARLMPGKTSNTLEKSRYPFRATDILLGA